MISNSQNAGYFNDNSAPFALRHVLDLLKQAQRWIRDARAVTTQRRRLAALSDKELLDIGISREDARREANRPFWDRPARS